MFNNPGTKIKNLANAFFWIEIIGGVLAMFIVTDGDIFEEPAYLFAIVAVVAVAYLSGLFLAAFGELVETNTAIKESNEKILAKMNEN